MLLGMSYYDWTFLILLPLAKVLFIVAIVVGAFTPAATLIERKLSARMQDRIGPNRAHMFKMGGKPVTLGGLFHTMADALKLLTKEWTTPATADRLLFYMAPVVGLIPALVIFAVLPFGPPVEVCGREVALQITTMNVGILFAFAIGSIGVYGAALAGWASNAKMALLGALRASAQSISYEITFGLTLVGLIMCFETVDLGSMVTQQGDYLFGFLPKWGVFLQPLGLVLFLTAAMAENKRIPFDLPEGESEIVGYFVEYSSMGFGLFMMTEFVEMVVIAFMLTALFFGGYHIPYVGAQTSSAAWWPSVLWGLQFATFFFKVIVLWLLQFMIRWLLPRFRYDQLMHLGWRIMLPLSLVNIGVTALALLLGTGEEYVAIFGLSLIGIFVLSLFYQRPAHVPAVAHDGHGHAPAAH
jgi:NADH-quinone oxidoreductase subunit H